MSNTVRMSAGHADQQVVTFPREADNEFDVVAREEIAELRKQLAERFAIGSGNLVVVEEPETLG